MSTTEAKTTNELAEERTDLAGRRTVMASDRTLMAWIRTALSMISFGFTIYKLLEGLQASGVALPRESTPRNIGLFLIGLGTISMGMGTIEYWQTVRELASTMTVRLWRSAFVLALIMSACGMLMFFSILTRLL